MAPSRESLAHALLFFILVITCALAVIVRLFSVVRFEVMIHEFDPYFNFRSTEKLVNDGFYAFHNWFDEKSWYPLGRGVGSSVYPGLMMTGAAIYNLLRAFQYNVDVRQVCVMMGPIFSGLTVLAAFFLTMEVSRGNRGASLFAAVLMSIVPGFISRSVAGSYDNECIAIFCMLLTFTLWLRSVRTGSMLDATAAAVAYLYMVSAWGGYIFLTNIIPLHVLGLILSQHFSHRAYVAYSTFYTIGTLLSMQVTFVGFKPTDSMDHLASLGIFLLCQLVAFSSYLRSKTTPSELRSLVVFAIIGLIGLVLVGATLTGKIGPLAGRLRFLFDTKNTIPIIASVAEHQPTSWGHYYFDLHVMMLLIPAGLYRCFVDLHEGTLFALLYGITTLYFTGIMVRIVLVLAPAACVLSGLALSHHFYQFLPNFSAPDEGERFKSAKEKKRAGADESYAFKSEIAAVALFVPVAILCTFVAHSVYMARQHYSDPTIVLSGNGPKGRIIFDDFREAYKWIAENTEEDAKVLSWWDYGYHLSSMANRTVYVDGNTWNNTHISRVGQILASNESAAYEMMRELDTNYVVVVFGGKIGFSGDDMNKFIWMIRIAGSTPTGEHIKQSQYMSKYGEYRVDKQASKAMRNSLMYKLCYYNFGAVQTHPQAPLGFDLSLHQEVGDKDITLYHLEEAYTTENWLIRIYRVKPPPNRHSL